MIERLRFPFAWGMANAGLLDELQKVSDDLYFMNPSLPVPSSFLFVAEGRIAAVYKGPVSVDRLLADIARLRVPGDQSHDASLPFAGRWHAPPGGLRAGAHSDLALSYANQGDWESAVVHYQHALADRPDFAGHNNLGTALAAKGELDAAVTHFRQALAIQPDRYETHYNLGTILARQNHPDQAAHHFRRVLEIRPDLTAARQQLEKIRRAQDAAVREPDLAEAHYNRGNTLLAQGDLDQAIDQYRQALQTSRDHAAIHYRLGATLQATGQLEPAIQHYRELVRLKPDVAESHYLLGAALAASGEPRRAIEPMRRAVELKPDDGQMSNDLAWYLATDAEAGPPQAEEAVRRAEHACELTDDEQPLFLDTLAVAYAATGRYDQAVATAEQALDLASTHELNELAQQIRARLELYRQNVPYHEPLPADQDAND